MAIVRTENIGTTTETILGLPRRYVYNMEYNPKTGLTEIKRTMYSTVLGQEIKALQEEIVFSNGWNSNSNTISQADKNKLSEKYTTILNALQKNPANKMPGFYTQGSSGSLPENVQPPLIEAVEALFQTPDLADYNTISIFNPSEIIKYPIDIISNGQDILEIVQYTYKPPYSDVISGEKKDNIGQLGVQRGSAIKKKIATLYLPIPNNVSDSNSAAWSGEPMDSISLSALGNMDKVATLTAIKSGTELLNRIPGLEQAISILGPEAAAIGKVLGAAGNFVVENPTLAYGLFTGTLFNPTLRKSLESLILKQIGFDIPIESVLSRGYGVVPNSNLELLFSGPSLRGFSFGYSMTPRSKNEAANCRKILRFFKQGMAPKKNQAKAPGYGAPSFLLGTPNVFKLSYKTWDYKTNQLKSISGLNKFKICALTNIQTSYAEGSWAAYEEGQPVRMTMQLAFKELEPVYESDYQDGIAKGFESISSGGDQDPVKPDDIGY